MRIAYVSADFGIPVLGNHGSSVHVREMVSAFAREGHEVQVFTPNPGTGNTLQMPLYLVAPGGLPDSSALPSLWSTSGNYYRLRKEIREIRYNGALYRSLYPQLAAWRPHFIYERYSLFGLAGLALAHRLGVPHLLEVNAPLREERTRTIGLLLRRTSEISDRLVFRGTSHVLVVSDALHRYVRAHGATAQRITVLPNGVDIKRFVPDHGSRGLRRSLGIRPDDFLIGFAGSLKPWHGVELLLEAFARLRQQNLKLHLLIVGNGPQRDAVKACVSWLGIVESVTFTGSLPHEQMAPVLASMDVAVAPYVDIPDFYFSPLKIFEYMATGLPIVASNAGDIGAIVRHGETGLLFSPGNVDDLTDCLRRVVTDRALAGRLGTQARRWVEEHSWDRNVQAVIGLVRSQTSGRAALDGALSCQESSR